MLKNWSQKGMSLVEVMVGGALLAGMGLVGAELFKRQSAATKYAMARSELDVFHDKVSKMVQDSRNCSVNFAASFGASTIAGTELSTALYQCCPNAATNSDCSYNSFAVYNTDPCMNQATYDWIGGRKAFVTVGQLVTPGVPGGFNLQSMSITDSAGNPVTSPPGVNAVVKGEIRMLYRKVDTASASGVPDVMKKIPVAFKFRDTGRFYGCVDAEIGTKNTLQQELCKSIGPNLATYNPSNDKCEYINTSTTHNCGTGVLTGIDSNGNEICKSANWAFDETQIIDSTNATTCTNTNVSFYWDSASNTIKVSCPP